jgi:curved DNA-binding protein CbpA
VDTGRPGDPFAALGLPAGPGLTDDDVRAAWRRVAAAAHPDRADGGDPARFAAAAAAYTALRTGFGRSEALADLAATAGRRGPLTAGWRRFRWSARARPGPGQDRGAAGRAGLTVARLASRVRRGRPGRLALRCSAVAAVSGGTALVAGTAPATPALITGAFTWLALTAHGDLAPPP